MTPEPRGEPGAVLRPDAARERIQLARHHPRPSLQPFVDYVWVVRWAVDEPFSQAVLTQPKVHLTAEEGRIRVYGVSRRTFKRVLTGKGKALGVAFRAGGFRAFMRPGERVGSLHNKVVLGNQLWPVDDARLARRTLAGDDDTGMVRCIEEFLESRHPARDPVADQVAGLVETIERLTWLRRVDELSVESGLSIRTLQRLFREYVGAAPKWVIQRRRLLDAAELVHAGESIAWADLAGELGYSDQAHLVRDFTAAVGTSPAAYAETVNAPSATR